MSSIKKICCLKYLLMFCRLRHGKRQITYWLIIFEYRLYFTATNLFRSKWRWQFGEIRQNSLLGTSLSSFLGSASYSRHKHTHIHVTFLSLHPSLSRSHARTHAHALTHTHTLTRFPSSYATFLPTRWSVFSTFLLFVYILSIQLFSIYKPLIFFSSYIYCTNNLQVFRHQRIYFIHKSWTYMYLFPL